MKDIVFIHGGHQGSWVWDELTESLKSNSGIGKILALDVPGCGKKTDSPEPSFCVNDIATELAQEILDAGIKKGIIVSHSQGGTLVPLIVSKTDSCFSEALFITTAVPLEGQTIREMLGYGLHGENDRCVGWPLDPETTDPQVLFKEMFCDKRMSREMLEYILQRAKIDNWPSATFMSDKHWGWENLIKIDKYYLIATEDNILPSSWQEKFASRLGDNTRKLYVDGGHQVMQTRPDTVANIIRDICKS